VRILFLSPRQCWPPRSGAKLREFHFLKALAQEAQVTYLHFTDPGSQPLTLEELPFCNEVVGIPKPGAYGLAKLIRGVVGRWPVSVLNYTSAPMSAAVDRAVSGSVFDLIHLDSIHMMRYRATSAKKAGGRIVYNWHNIESEAMRRYGATVTSRPRRWYARLTASKLAGLERETLKTGFGHVVCSEREKEELNRIAPSARVAVVENGVDVESFSRGSEVLLPAQKVIFVGLMDYYPNIEAATSFTNRIWPALRERFPGLTLWIVGANPVPAVVELGNLDGVTVTGTVADVRPYYRDAAAAIVPLRTGGGTRLKILEAMAAGVPVISSPLGCEGLAVTPSEDILLADPDDASAWVRHMARLSSAAERTKLTGAALQLVRSRYDWQILGRRLCNTYKDWLKSDV